MVPAIITSVPFVRVRVMSGCFAMALAISLLPAAGVMMNCFISCASFRFSVGNIVFGSSKFCFRIISSSCRLFS